MARGEKEMKSPKKFIYGVWSQRKLPHGAGRGDWKSTYAIIWAEVTFGINVLERNARGFLNRREGASQ